MTKVAGVELGHHGIPSMHVGIHRCETTDGGAGEIVEYALDHGLVGHLEESRRSGATQGRVEQTRPLGREARLVVVHGESVEIESCRARKGDAVVGERLWRLLQQQVGDDAADVSHLLEEALLGLGELGTETRHPRARNGDDRGVGDQAPLATRGQVTNPGAPLLGLDQRGFPSDANREPIGEGTGQQSTASLEALESKAAGQEANCQQRERPREILGIAIEGGRESRCEQVFESLLADDAPQVASHVIAIDVGRPLRVQGIEAFAVAKDLEKKPREPSLRSAGEQVRAQELSQRVVVTGMQLPVAENRVAGAADVLDAVAQAEGVGDLVQVSVAAGDELGAAVDEVPTAALAAHAPARRPLALQHLDVVPRLLQPPGAGEARDPGTDHDHRGQG